MSKGEVNSLLLHRPTRTNAIEDSRAGDSELNFLRAVHRLLMACAAQQSIVEKYSKAVRGLCSSVGGGSHGSQAPYPLDTLARCLIPPAVFVKAKDTLAINIFAVR